MDKFLCHLQSCLALDLKRKENSCLLGTALCDKKLEERFDATLHVSYKMESLNKHTENHLPEIIT